MATLRLAPHLTVEQIRERMQGEGTVRLFRKWQILHAVATHSGIKARDIARLLGTSAGIVRRTVQFYNKQGASFIDHLRWGGRREAGCVMSLEAEQNFLQEVEARALRGEVLVARQLRAAVEQKAGRPVSEDYLWDILHRHGWSKKAPRPEHPKGVEVKEQREAFKKKPPPCFPHTAA